ncbi:MAG: hypothetical protein LUF04_09950 [Bacteroides sp.]|nr:hypothetical protein [Bacteroides sp.]
MKKIFQYNIYICLLLSAVLFACTDDKVTGGTTPSEDGAPLILSVGFESYASTRLAELPDPDAMNDAVVDGENYGLNHVGLYIYYTDDYEANGGKGDLSKPYVRNMECKIVDNRLVPVDPLQSEYIYIYDRMTVVAFYPYNADMSDPDNYFDVKADEENYPITRRDYAEQYYIPYRAELETNPTIAYAAQLWFYPKQTVKFEIVLVSDDPSMLPQEADVQIVPRMDPIDNDEMIVGGRREKGVDHVNTLNPSPVASGSYVKQYVAYVWKNETFDNNLNQGELLLESDLITLFASQDVELQEQYVYRYGYNLSTGEIFIPTSSYLIHDATSLQGLNGVKNTSYQVCDIDVSSISNWKPLSLLNATFDGGGHKVEGLTINGSDSSAGLFGQIKGNSSIRNVNLIEPQITINSTADSCSVGGICGTVNGVMTEAEKESLLGSLPEGLSEVVKQELIKELLLDIVNSTSRVIASRVEDPVITVNGKSPRVGTICGSNGDKDKEDNYYGTISDSYSLGGTIRVNEGDPSLNAGAYVGGFCGLNNGKIVRGYVTIDDMSTPYTTTNASGETVTDDLSAGFTHNGNLFTGGEIAVTDSYSVWPDTTSGVQQLPASWPTGWVDYTGIWPVNTSGWTESNSFWYDLGTQGTENYPILQWERR